MMRKSILLMFSLIVFNLSFSQTKFKTLESIPFGQNSQTILTPIHGLPNIDIRNKVENAKFYFKVYFDDAFDIHKGLSWEYSITLNVTNNLGTSYASKTLELSNDNPELIYTFEFTDAIDVINDFVVNTSFSMNNLPSDESTYLNTNTKIEIYTEVDYLWDVRKSSNIEQLATPLIISNPSMNNINFGVSSKVVDLNWDYSPFSSFSFPNYQVQLLKLRPKTLSINEDVITADIDWSKALNIETQSDLKNLSITMAEGSGFYVWRVRPIGTFFKGGIADNRNYGEWSLAPSNGEVTIDAGQVILDPSSPYFKYIDMDEKYIYSYSRTFVEDGKIGENITYANGLNITKQVQAHQFSNDKTVVNQFMIDYSGRPSLSTIPVPVDGGLNGYKEQFVTTGVGSNKHLYTADDFDTDANYRTPSIINQDAYTYYDGNNNDRVANAEGYPFTRTIFYNDGSGKPFEQSGIGVTHMIQPNIDDESHTTKTYFSTPSQQELIRVFGLEAPSNTSVYKTTVVDPNGTKSISYTSKEGFTIATALSGNKTGSGALETLDGMSGNIYDGTSIEFPVENIINQNISTENGFYSSKRLSFSESTNLNIIYEYDEVTFEQGCLDGNCDYDIQFFIYDIINQVNYYTDSMKQSDADGASITGFFDANNNELDISAIPPGDYIFYKILSIDDSQLQSVLDNVSTNAANGIEPLIELLSVWANNINSEQELINFYTKIDLLVNDLTDLQLGTITSTNFIANYTNFSITDIPTLMEINIGFSIPVTDAANAPYFNNLIIGGAPCCTSGFNIPVEYIPSAPCYTAQELNGFFDNGGIEEITDSLGYTQYLYNLINNYPGVYTNPLSYYIPGYPYEVDEVNGKILESHLDLMIYYMLTDNFNNPGNCKTEAYSCSDLWGCWVTSVQQLPIMIEQISALGNPYNGTSNGIDNGPEDENGISYGNTGNDNQSEDHLDDPDNKSGGKFIQWLIKKKLKNIPDFMANADYKPVQLNVVDLFLDCIQPNYEGIISSCPYELSDFTSQHDYDAYIDLMNDTYSNVELVKLKDIDNTSQPYESLDDILVNGQSQLIYSNIMNPVFIFKYYEYNSCSDCNTVNPLLPNSLSIEIQNCYEDLNTNPSNYIFTGVSSASHPVFTGLPLDFNDEPINNSICDYNCTSFHDTWNCTEITNFYNQISNLTFSVDESALDIDTDLDWETDLGIPLNNNSNYSSNSTLPDGACNWIPPGETNSFEDDALIYFDNLFIDCITNCRAREGQIRADVIQMFLDNCYNIDYGCPDDATVSMLQIDEMVESIINTMTLRCNAIKIEAESLNYPLFYSSNCYLIDVGSIFNGSSCTIPLISIPNCEVKYLPACLEKELEQLSFWRFEVDIAESRCFEAIDNDGDGVNDNDNVYNQSVSNEQRIKDWWNNTNACETDPINGNISNSSDVNAFAPVQEYIFPNP